MIYTTYFAALLLAAAQLFVFEAFGMVPAWREA
jgi:hypothetical protein